MRDVQLFLMGVYYRWNALIVSYTMHLRHMRLWCMFLVYCSHDILLVNGYIFFKFTTGGKTHRNITGLSRLKGLIVRGLSARGHRHNISMLQSLHVNKRLVEDTNKSATTSSNSAVEFPMRFINVSKHFPMFWTDTKNINCKYCYPIQVKVHRQVKTLPRKVRCSTMPHK